MVDGLVVVVGGVVVGGLVVGRLVVGAAVVGRLVVVDRLVVAGLVVGAAVVGRAVLDGVAVLDERSELDGAAAPAVAVVGDELGEPLDAEVPVPSAVEESPAAPSSVVGALGPVGLSLAILAEVCRGPGVIGWGDEDCVHRRRCRAASGERLRFREGR